MRLSLASLAAGSLLAAVPLSASTMTENEPPEASSLSLVRTVAGHPEDRRPLAKLRSPLCLVVAAEDQDFARVVARRIIDNARTAGVRTARAGCSPNALVSFTDDARAQMQAVREGGRKLFRRMSEKEIDAALAARDPAYVFQAVEMTPRIGEGDADFGVAAGGDNWTSERSVLRTPQDLLTTMVVFEDRAIGGYSPVQLADYATLRLLAPTAEVAPDAALAPRTILSLFVAPTEAPREWTASDRAYLHALYTLPRTAFAQEVLATAAVKDGR